jgi:radical SAM protein
LEGGKDLEPEAKPRDYNEYPFVVVWEVTRACALQCLHCRAEAQYAADPHQLSYEEGIRLIDQIAELDNPLFILTGGDPLMRPDLFDLVEYAVKEKKLSVAMTPSATPKVTLSAMRRAKEAGLSRWAFSLDGSGADIHDHFRGSPGSYALTMQSIDYLKELGLPLQFNTTVSRYNVEDLEAIAEKVEEMNAVMWNVFFLIPTGRAMARDMISPERHEEVIRWLAHLSRRVKFAVKTTEAPFYRRIYMQESELGLLGPSAVKRKDIIGRAPKSVNDGDGFVFVSHTGEVCPSGFLPHVCGNVREQPLADIYRKSPVMRDLRNKSLLKGKCGLCEYKVLCGGSRARAYTMTGDYTESDPACPYIPKAFGRLSGNE